MRRYSYDGISLSFSRSSSAIFDCHVTAKCGISAEHISCRQCRHSAKPTFHGTRNLKRSFICVKKQTQRKARTRNTCALFNARSANEERVNISEPYESLVFYTKEGKNEINMKVGNRGRRNDRKEGTKERKRKIKTPRERQQASRQERKKRRKKARTRQASLAPNFPDMGKVHQLFCFLFRITATRWCVCTLKICASVAPTETSQRLYPAGALLW